MSIIYISLKTQGQQVAGLKTTGLGIIISTLAYPFIIFYSCSLGGVKKIIYNSDISEKLRPHLSFQNFQNYICFVFSNPILHPPPTVAHIKQKGLDIDPIYPKKFEFLPYVHFFKDFQYKTFRDFLCFQIALTRLIFRKMFFFLNRSEFRQKLIGYVFSELRRQKCV